MKYLNTLFIMVSLLGCTPSATSTNQRSAQDSALSGTQSSALGHREDTQSVPINIMCVQVFSDTKDVQGTPCFQREGAGLPGDRVLK
jgi:hypothetical protein